MNIQRMLNVFILIFLAINVILFYTVNYLGKETYTLTYEQEALLKEVTDAKNIVLYTTPPEFSPKPRLIIRKPIIDEKALMDRMFGEEEQLQPTFSDDQHIRETEKAKLTFNFGKENGLVYYAAKEVTYVPAVFNDDGYDRIVKDFVSDFTLDNGNFELVDERESSDRSSIIYYFNERFQGELLLCNEVVVKLVREKGITEARVIRYVPQAYEETVRELYAVDEAIYGLMAAVNKDPEEVWRITDMEIGYHLGPDDVSRLYNMAIEPYYQLKLGTGDTFLINAYTKELITDY